MLPLVLGLLLRIKSLNELNCMLKENEIKNSIPKGERVPQIDTIRDTLKSIDLKGLEKINVNIGMLYSKAKLLHDYWGDAFYN